MRIRHVELMLIPGLTRTAKAERKLTLIPPELHYHAHGTLGPEASRPQTHPARTRVARRTYSAADPSNNATLLKQTASCNIAFWTLSSSKTACDILTPKPLSLTMGFLEKFLPKEDRFAALMLYGMVFSTCFNGYDAGIMTVILADDQFTAYYNLTPTRQGVIATAPWATTGLAQLFVGGLLASYLGRIWALRIAIVFMCLGV